MGYRFYRSIPALLGLGPIFQSFFKQRLPFDLPRSFTKEWARIGINDLVLVLVFAALSWFSDNIGCHHPHRLATRVPDHRLLGIGIGADSVCGMRNGA